MMAQQQQRSADRPVAAIRPRLVGGATVTRRQFLGVTATAAVGALLAACGGAATATTVAPAAAPRASATTGGTTAAPSAAASSTTVQKVNANTATQAELLAAFQAAGIANADRWVREVLEYRPYPTNDPTFAKLRSELAKYNPGPGVVDQIIAVLSL